MAFDTAFVIKVFAALFAIMNPIANVTVFLSLTEGSSAGDQKKVAIQTIVCTLIGCLIVIFAGRHILDLFGISVDDFRLSGGLLVLLIALSMLHGSPSHMHSATSQEKDAAPAPTNVAIYPLTLPLLVGPGTIATLIVFAETARAQSKLPELAAGLGLFLLLLAAALLAAPFLGRFLTQNATAVTRRLMGMILAAVAMEMIVAGLRAVFPMLGHAS